MEPPIIDLDLTPCKHALISVTATSFICQMGVIFRFWTDIIDELLFIILQ